MSRSHLRPPGSPGGLSGFRGQRPDDAATNTTSNEDTNTCTPSTTSPNPSGVPPPSAPALPRCADGNGTLTPLFFSDDIIDIARAKAICGKCPLAASCLRAAQEREEPWGVWGGELLLNGRIVKNKRPCGRPPKHPRPELIIDELGVVGSVA